MLPVVSLQERQQLLVLGGLGIFEQIRNALLHLLVPIDDKLFQFFVVLHVNALLGQFPHLFLKTLQLLECRLQPLFANLILLTLRKTAPEFVDKLGL